jgi:glycerophosphoryl diester phosphodiesterase
MSRRGRLVAVVIATLAAVVAVCTPDSVITGSLPLVHAHSHNDYEHSQPLFEALSHGFCSFEADIHLVDGQLLVAHDRDQARPDRTLQALYLDPLRDRVSRNGARVYPHGPACTLLIDVKSDAAGTYAALREVLERNADILTVFRGEKVERRAITAIVSGNSARWIMASEPLRYAALDGALADLSSNASSDFIPWISMDWRRTFTWNGTGGPMPKAEEQLLRQIVSAAHRQGRKVRFWGTPDVPDMWQALWNARVDLITTDDLLGLERFLRARHLRFGAVRLSSL